MSWKKIRFQYVPLASPTDNASDNPVCVEVGTPSGWSTKSDLSEKKLIAEISMSFSIAAAQMIGRYDESVENAELLVLVK